MKVDVLLGLQWGDEGKGKIVDVLTPNYDIIARFQGGPNAGHTLEFNGIKHVLHTIPSGIFRDGVMNLVGNGVVIDPVIFKVELDKLEPFNIDYKSRLVISKKAHLILPTHRILDAASEASKGKDKIGSTLKGIGPTYMDKTGRNGLRIGDIYSPKFQEKYNALVEKHKQMLRRYEGFEYDLTELEGPWLASIESLKELTAVDSEQYINDAMKAGKKILAEGAQGTMLDIDFGTYPFVTSSNTVTAGTCTGLGVAPTKIGDVIGIFKAYCTRVGSGPFPTELEDQTGEKIRKEGSEFGATTGRQRRCGWLDLVILNRSFKLNAVSGICLTKLDVMDDLDLIKICIAYDIDGQQTTIPPFSAEGYGAAKPIYIEMPGWKTSTIGTHSFEDLPSEAQNYIRKIEELSQIPVDILSTGPDRDETLILKNPFE